MCYTPRKHLGHLYFPIVSSGHFSVPVIFAQTRTVTRSLGLFVPVHTSPLNACVLSGNNRQYRPVSSTSFGSYLLKTGLSILCFQSSHTFLSTVAFSPLIRLYATLCQTFHRLNHPLEHAQSGSPNSLLNSSAFTFKISPLIGTDCSLVAVNHWNRAASTSGLVGSLQRFHLDLPAT